MQKLGIDKKSLKEDKPVKAEVGGKALAVVLHKGNVYAIYAACTHEEGPLDEGTIEGEEIVCPWHQGRYALATGKANEETPWVHDTPVYKVVEDKATGELSVEM